MPVEHIQSEEEGEKKKAKAEKVTQLFSLRGKNCFFSRFFAELVSCEQNRMRKRNKMFEHNFKLILGGRYSKIYT